MVGELEIGIDELFAPRLTYPDPDARERLAELVGLDAHRTALSKFLAIAVNPSAFVEWTQQHHPEAADSLSVLLRRPPLAVLAGDVGTGKTVLAETIGDCVARAEDLPVTLYPMSLSTRGQGRVGEMTQLITAAFDTVYEEAKKYKRPGNKPSAASLLLVDEADALAQSREAQQMHHEDRAGVNAFIRVVDRLAEPHLPAAVIMCTNRLSALDPAVRRRSGELLVFSRPSDEQRRAVLAPMLLALGLNEGDVRTIVEATGAVNGRTTGCTYSDLTQRLLPGIVMQAFPSQAVDPAAAIQAAISLQPTPAFEDQ